jgi:Holliday junction resolvase-like predicted endonuclease
MGPTGHPFEKLVGEILKTQGYNVKVAEMVKGHCVTHEVDVVAEKPGRRLMVECKFHNGAGVKSDVKIVLYVWARFEDIRRAWQALDGQEKYFNQAWLATNTKLTSDAIQYAECMGLHAVSWEYPPGESLPVLIERAGLHPITALTGLTRPEKRQLTAKGIILCRELNGSALAEIGITGSKAEAVMKELEELCRKM